MDKQYHVYILANQRNTVLYTGVTNDLQRRVHEHKTKAVAGFTARFNIDKLVYFEATDDVAGAIGREKQIKGGSRQKKIDLTTRTNPTWRDLFEDL